MSEKTNPLDTVLCRLDPIEYDLFRRHCTQGETLIHIAETMNRPPEAVRQGFCLLRRRLQTLLIEAGLKPNEAMDYLYRALTAHH